MILFYVSGHGYGHATRSRAVMDALHQLRPDIPIGVRTTAPATIFGQGVTHWPVEIEPRIVESADALTVDEAASAAALTHYLDSLSSLVTREVDFVRASNVQLIVADVPFAAGLIARGSHVRSVAMGNFTWDWIFEPVGTATIRDAYTNFDVALRMPLSQPTGWDMFRECIDVPLVTPKSKRARQAIRDELRIGSRPAVLIGGRARPDPCTLQHLARTCHDYHFVAGDALPCFHDLVRATDAVVSKIGYSSAAECIAEGRAFLFPPRNGFREEQILSVEAPKYMRALSIDVGDWRAGNWKSCLDRLMKLPAPENRLASNGAEVCAREILKRWSCTIKR